MNAIDYFRSIDGNWILRPVGYCTYHRGYVSERQARVHKCHRKHGGTCGRLANMEGRLIKNMTQQQFYDKIVDRMDKLIVATNKLTKTLEAMQKREIKQYPDADLVIPLNTHVHLPNGENE